jgi:hypothetical protein
MKAEAHTVITITDSSVCSFVFVCSGLHLSLFLHIDHWQSLPDFADHQGASIELLAYNMTVQFQVLPISSVEGLIGVEVINSIDHLNPTNFRLQSPALPLIFLTKFSAARSFSSQSRCSLSSVCALRR